MALTDVAIRKARPGPKPIKLSDEKGLHLEIVPHGGKWWRLASCSRRRVVRSVSVNSTRFEATQNQA